jgi:Raf kinase inhibitor-like YbhB/YbcL family protein
MVIERLMKGRAWRRIKVAAALGLAGLVLLTSTGCWRGDSLPAEDSSRLTMVLRSPAFAEGEMIPQAYTCDGSDRSPPLDWSGVPGSAQSLALICDDPDAPMGTWSHWVVLDLDPAVQGLKEGVPAEDQMPADAMETTTGDARPPAPAIQGKNDFDKHGYGGPCPPGGTHRYVFRLYALDTRLNLTPSTTRADALKAIQGHILAEGRLVGKYKRTKS